MTPRYEWTPASEPPDTRRMVLVWVRHPDGSYDWSTDYFYGNDDWEDSYIIYWRDVEPPKDVK